MKHLSRGLTAGAAGLLLTAGLAGTAGAAVNTCTATVANTAVGEGNTGTTNLVFTVDIVEVGNGCNPGGTISYTLTDGTATSPADYTSTGGTVPVGANGGQQTITVPVVGDTTVEPDETFTLTLTAPGGVDVVGSPATGTITNDDAPPVDGGGLIGATGTSTTDPTSGAPGTVITVSGTECTGEEGGAFLVQKAGDPATQDDDVLLDEATVAPAADGSFEVELTVPADADPAGEYYIVSGCATGDTAEYYDDIAFDVTPAATGGGNTGTPTGGNGYRMVAADGGIFTFGDRQFWGSTGNIPLNKPIVGGATDKSDYEGYWIVASDGGVFAFNAEFYGSLAGQTLAAPVAEIEPTPTGKGYWIVLENGKVYTFGDADFFGDISATKLNSPVIGMSVTPSGQGYWLVGKDGGIFDYGDADFFGSMGDKKLNAPVIDLAPAVDNAGYYLLGADGGVFTFGSADFKGSTGDIKLNKPVVAMLVAPTGAGYWLAASDGGLFTFGAVEYLGSMGGTPLNSPVLDLIN